MSEMDGGPAFPSQPYGSDGLPSHQAVDGMSLLDWFAGQVLPEVVRLYAEKNDCGIGAEHLPRNCAAHAYRLAYAMLESRKGASNG